MATEQVTLREELARAIEQASNDWAKNLLETDQVFLNPWDEVITERQAGIAADAAIALIAARQPSREEFAEALAAFVNAAATDLLIHVAVQELNAPFDDDATAQTARNHMESVKALIDRALVGGQG